MCILFVWNKQTKCSRSTWQVKVSKKLCLEMNDVFLYRMFKESQQNYFMVRDTCLLILLTAQVHIFLFLTSPGERFCLPLTFCAGIATV